MGETSMDWEVQNLKERMNVIEIDVNKDEQYNHRNKEGNIKEESIDMCEKKI